MTRDEIDPVKLYPASELAGLIGCSTMAMWTRLRRDPRRYAAVRVEGERGWFIPGTTLLRYFAKGVETTPRRQRGDERAAIERAKALV